MGKSNPMKRGAFYQFGHVLLVGVKGSYALPGLCGAYESQFERTTVRYWPKDKHLFKKLQLLKI
jgi:hypothetical protein